MSLSPILVCGPSGVGKDTLVNRLLLDYPGIFGKVVSHTTRAPRNGETNGVQYYFIDVAQMQKEISEGKFFEHAQVYNNIYGIATSSITKVSESGKIGLLILDIQGIRILSASDLNPFRVFVMPPNLESLKHRLYARGTDSEIIIAERLSKTQEEIDNYQTYPELFDVLIVNENLEEAYQHLLVEIRKRYQITL